MSNRCINVYVFVYSVGIVQLLLDNGASPQALNRRKETPFQCSHSPDVKYLRSILILEFVEKVVS